MAQLRKVCLGRARLLKDFRPADFSPLMDAIHFLKESKTQTAILLRSAGDAIRGFARLWVSVVAITLYSSLKLLEWFPLHNDGPLRCWLFMPTPKKGYILRLILFPYRELPWHNTPNFQSKLKREPLTSTKMTLLKIRGT
jgi:hypothetical protein